MSLIHPTSNKGFGFRVDVSLSTQGTEHRVARRPTDPVQLLVTSLTVPLAIGAVLSACSSVSARAGKVSSRSTTKQLSLEVCVV